MTGRHERRGAEQGSAAGVLRRLRAAGLEPRKHRDQHFLHDPRLLRAIARDARISVEDHVFEVGTGPGTLTRHLADLAGRVVTVEKDPGMAAFAERDLGSPDHVTFLRGDVLEGRRLNPRVEEKLREIEPFVWVSNLPYSVAATLLVAVLESGLVWLRAALLVQKEVAARIAARPGDRAYGPLGAIVAFRARARAGREVSAGAFWPPPRVTSGLVHLEPSSLGGEEDYRGYVAWVRELFRSRRKQLRGLLRDALGDERAAEALAATGLDPRARAEEMAPESFLVLARRFPLKVV